MEIIQRIGDEMVAENLMDSAGYQLGATSPSGGGSGFFGKIIGGARSAAQSLSPWADLIGTGLQVLTYNPDSKSYVDFDATARRNFKEGTRLSDAASKSLRDSLSRMGAQRYQALVSDYDQQLAEARKIGSQTMRDISQSYDAQAGRVGQGLISSGLYNTTVAPGLNALVNRERSAALSRAGSQQASLMTGLLGQRASALAGERSALDAALSGILGQDYSIRATLAQRLATPSQKTERSGSILDSIFN
jgi:hypothetical protein